MATRLYIKENTLIKQLNNDNGFVVDARNVKFDNGSANGISVFDKINSLSFSPALNGTSLLWYQGTIPSSINANEEKQITVKIFAKYNNNWYKDVTSSLISITTTGGTASISGTTLTIKAPNVTADTQIKITFTYNSQYTEKTYIATAVQQSQYTISWNGNGATTQASGGSSTVIQGNSVTLPTTDPKREYNITWNNNNGSGANGGSTKAIYTFNNWWTSTTGGVQVTSSTIPTGNATYYAHWTDPSSITLPTTNPTREGYTFQGWATASTATTPNVSSSTKPNANVTYYAVWGQAVTYYWYVGMTKPTASTNPESNLTTSTGAVQETLGWIKLTSTPSEVHPYNDPRDFVHRTWWVAIPTEYNFQAYNTAGSAPDNVAWPHNETVTITGVQYTLFHNVNPMDSINVVLKP